MTTVDVPRPAVPPPIALLRDFVNTTDHELGTDDLAAPHGLDEHLHAAGLLRGTAGGATDADLALAVRLRSGLRRALACHHDGVQDPLPELDEVLEELPVALTWTPEGVATRPHAPGVRGALAAVALAALEATAAGLFPRLKICASDECEWAYYDFSRNRSRHWCEYGCGNKLKTRAYRARRAAGRG